MSAGNYFLTRKKAFDLRKVTLTAATYTVKVGTPAEDFVDDRVIDVDVCPCVVTVPDGTYCGQRLLIFCSASTIVGIVDVNCDGTGTDIDLNATDEFVSYEWVGGTSGWIILASNP